MWDSSACALLQGETLCLPSLFDIDVLKEMVHNKSSQYLSPQDMQECVRLVENGLPAALPTYSYLVLKS